MYDRGMEKLSSSDREFFSRVYDSAFLNPFSDERLDSDASAVGKPKADEAFAFLGELLAKLDERLRMVLGGGHLVSDYGFEDAQLLEIALLFKELHSHRGELDSYIRAQSLEGDQIIPADFASGIFQEIHSNGIPVERAENYVALMFQTRRAYYFISTGLTGRCKSVRELRKELWNAIFTHDAHLYVDRLWNRLEDFSTLLLGETGTGKGAAAQALGRSNYIPYQSQKKRFTENFTKAFLSINLSEFSENLIESELFGHKKGSFTGAVGDREGIFSRCSRRGAIFLDEVGELSEQIQIKLLRILQQRVFSPVGGYEILRFGGRIIAATNQDIAKRRMEGKFRNDFYYRLSSVQIRVPTLRQRIEETESELELLVSDIVRRLVGEEEPKLTERLVEVMRLELPKRYQWPGNVRELEQAVRSILLTGHYRGEAVFENHSGVEVDQELGKCLRGELTLEEVTEWYCRRLYRQLGSYGAVAERVGVDWRTVKQKILPRV